MFMYIGRNKRKTNRKQGQENEVSAMKWDITVLKIKTLLRCEIAVPMPGRRKHENNYKSEFWSALLR